MKKHISIAVVGASSSGKSYLLYDMIHAFGVMGYQPEELPLSYPHSSFGAYFYDTFNNETGGMRGTERYACRPERHYGAYLSKGRLHPGIEVDFLNIPGEVFDTDQKRMGMFFELKQLIERRAKGLFFLSVWQSPSGEETRLILPLGFDISSHTRIKAEGRQRTHSYMTWGNIAYELEQGRFSEVSRKSVSGKYLLQHITELNTDSLLLTLKACWSQLTEVHRLLLADYDANLVFFYFYPLMYCQQATDIILCDKLMLEEGTGDLAYSVSQYMEKSTSRRPHVYLAFRGADLLLRQSALQQRWNEGSHNLRNSLYEAVLTEVEGQLSSTPAPPTTLIDMSDAFRAHINQSVGAGLDQAFWQLLNSSYSHGRLHQLINRIAGRKDLYALAQSPNTVLPPHVYLTATPIDSRLRIYKSDEADVTRFYSDDGSQLRTFTHEVDEGHSGHLCFGSYQLLTDLLLQNGIPNPGQSGRGSHLLYMQSQL